MNLIERINEINEEIATRYIGKFIDENITISELHMHKIMFHVYGAFYKHFKKELFNANFEAWKYGPVEINYRNILKSGSKDFSLFNINFELTDKQNEYLDNVIDLLLKKSAWELVELSHLIPAWENNFDINKEHCKIPNKDIQESFKFVKI